MHEHGAAHLETSAGQDTFGVAPSKPSAAAAGSQVLQTLDISIGGTTCPHCPSAIEKTLRGLAGVQQASVNLAARTAHIAFDPARIKIPSLLRVIRSAGYIPGAAKVRIPIANMHCTSCTIRIQLELKMTPGVIKAEASLMTNAVDVEYNPEQTTFEALTAAIGRAGYRAVPPKLEVEGEIVSEEAATAAECRLLMHKFWFAAAIAVPVMGLSYPDLIPGLREWMPAGSETRRIVWALLGLLSLPVMLWSGSQFFTGMWDALKHRAANMHTLIAIGISAAFLYSIVAVAWPGLFPQMSLAEVFWDVTDVVVALVVLGLALDCPSPWGCFTRSLGYCSPPSLRPLPWLSARSRSSPMPTGSAISSPKGSHHDSRSLVRPSRRSRTYRLHRLVLLA